MNRQNNWHIFILLSCCFFAIGASVHQGAPSDSSILRLIVLSGIMVVFLILTAFYAGSETALVSVNKIRINQLVEEGNKSAKIVQRLVEAPDKMLGLTLVGTNLMHVITSELGLLLAIALLGSSSVINTVVEKLRLDVAIVATALTTTLILIFGEILPKTIFRAKADALALRYAYPLRISEIIFGAVVNGVTFLTNLLVKSVDRNAESVSPDAQRDELRLLATMGEQSGDILKDQRRMIHSVLDLRNRTVEQVMVPLVDIVAAEKNTDIETFLQIASDSGFSRIPIYKGHLYNVIGVVHLLDVIYANDEAQTIEPFIRTGLQFVPESQSINVLLKDIPRSDHTMVFVVDEYGGLVGLVTVEDLIEEIVGEVSDERDAPQSIRMISPRILECDGRAEIDTLSEWFGVPIPSGNYETIAGYILEQTGTIPKSGAQTDTDELIITISDADARAIRRVRIQSKRRNFTHSELER
jgi:putative hemolysin